jgi:hypothetical protein
MSWFKSVKSSISIAPSDHSAAAAVPAELPPAELELAEQEMAGLETARPTIPETVRPVAKLNIAKLDVVKLADVVLRESPKAVFDTAPREKPSRQKIGFTVHASKNGETNETQRTSPTITVAKARMLFKSGWLVHIADAAGRKYGPSEFDEILKFDRY